MSEQEATSKVDLLLPTFKVSESRTDSVGGKVAHKPGDQEEPQQMWVKDAQFSAQVELHSMTPNAASISSKLSGNA